MKICVLIASHINNLKQINLLDNCINSLINQTVKPDIFISISFENEILRKNFIDNIYNKYTNINYTLCDNKTYQIIHFFYLLKKIKDYNFIMFCDDDDTYEKNRVEEFKRAYTYLNDTTKDYNFIIKDGDTNNKYSPEYWNYGIPYKFLYGFFELFENDMDLLNHYYADIIFSKFLSTRKNIKYLIIKDTYYNYNYNINSTCNVLNLKSYNEKIELNLFLYVICNNLRKQIEETMSFFDFNENNIRLYLPNYDRIKNKLSFIFSN